MEVEYSIGLEDLLAFNQYRNAHSPAMRRQVLVARLAIPVACGVLWLLLAGLLDVGGRIFMGVVLGLVGIIYFCILPANFRRRTHRLVARMYMEGHNRGLYARRRLTITPETITEATEISVTTMKWVAVEKIVVDQRHVYFYVSAANAFILPKAAFATEAELKEFVETAQRHQRDAPG